MRVVTYDRYGGPEVLELGERDRPSPAEGEVLIRVAAAAVNPADGKWRAGMFAGFAPLTFPHVPGYDVAGVVEAGDGDAPIAGTRVMVMLDTGRHGGYAQWVATAASRAARIPDALSFAQAAAIPTAGLTGVQLIEEQLDLQPGQTVLLTGATGAVGRFAIHAARARGARVIAAVRAAQRQAARAIGADAVLTLGAETWTGAPFDHVGDTVGGDAVAALCRHLRPGGRIRTAATTPIAAEGLAAEPVFFAVRPDAARLEALARTVAAGEIAVPVASVLPLDQAAEAQRLVDAGGLGGKIVLMP